ncbi:MAG: hypothetical protein QOK39_895 [Acidimicrobiaceae bacterium]|nr:hypothetical protein [Acidimicrobiaceae bacterium]
MDNLWCRRASRGLVGLVVAVIPFVITMPSAFAGVGVGVTPTFPTTVSVGDTGIPAALQILNNSTPPDNVNPVTIDTITLVPSCGSGAFTGAGDCNAVDADPGVFQLSAVGFGESGTACAGQTFTISTVSGSTTGKQMFTPSGGPVVLQPPGQGGSVCRIDFTIDVIKAPTKDASAAPGLQTDQIAFAHGVNGATGSPGSGIGESITTVNVVTPVLNTVASAATVAGQPVSDNATVSGGTSPTGTVTFRLFGPNDSSCTGAVIFTSVQAVAGNGSYTSSSFTPNLIGTYRWTAAYSGDANNTPVTSPCNAANESVAVSKATPNLSTHASASVPVGGKVTDTATVAGGANPTGVVVFKLFAPSDTNCTGTAVFTASRPVTGNGNYTTSMFTPTTTGIYRWVTTYRGDANNNAVTDACNSDLESVTVTRATPVITWANPAPITHGTPLSSTQLNATANVPGTFVYNPPAGTVLPVGNNQPLTVTFTPTDLHDYTKTSKTVHINVT